MSADPHACSWPTARTRAADVPPLEPRQVALEAAVGLVLAQDVRAACELPPCDTSAMDGYAVAGRSPWRLVGSLRAEQVWPQRLRFGEAVEIATGAAVPAGTASVLRYEHASGCDDRIAGVVEAGRDIRPSGTDLGAGEVLIAASMSGTTRNDCATPSRRPPATCTS